MVWFWMWGEGFRGHSLELNLKLNTNQNTSVESRSVAWSRVLAMNGIGNQSIFPKSTKKTQSLIIPDGSRVATMKTPNGILSKFGQRMEANWMRSCSLIVDTPRMASREVFHWNPTQIRFAPQKRTTSNLKQTAKKNYFKIRRIHLLDNAPNHGPILRWNNPIFGFDLNSFRHKSDMVRMLESAPSMDGMNVGGNEITCDWCKRWGIHVKIDRLMDGFSARRDEESANNLQNVLLSLCKMPHRLRLLRPHSSRRATNIGFH